MLNRLFNLMTKTSFKKTGEYNPKITLVHKSERPKVVYIHRYSYVYPTYRTFFIW